MCDHKNRKIVKPACFFLVYTKRSVYSVKYSLAEISNLAQPPSLSFFLDRNREEINTEEHGSILLDPSLVFSLRHITYLPME